MNEKTLFVFKELMKKGYISKETDTAAYNYFNDNEISDELEMMERELGFKIFKSSVRIYLIPNQTNELFLQDNNDFRKTVGSDARLDDIYLLNYLGIYLLYTFYHGVGKSPLCREFISISDFISDFTAHCEKIKSESEHFENASNLYSIDFIRITDNWLAKKGAESGSFDTKYGCLMKIIRKFQNEELFSLEDEKLKPTRKLNDLMPYFLSQQRISDINSIFGGGNNNAVNS